MAYDLEFVVAVAFACVFFGILIGMAVIKSYEKLACVVSQSSNRHQPPVPAPARHVNDNVRYNARRISDISWQQVHAMSGNPNIPSIFEYPASATVVQESRLPVPNHPNPNLELARLESSDETHRKKFARKRRLHSEPAQSTDRNLNGSSNRSGGTNNVNRKTRHYGTNPDIRSSSNRTDPSRGSFKNTRHGEDTYTYNGGSENNNTSSTNIKEPGNKTMPPLTLGGVAGLGALPIILNQSEDHDTGSSIDDLHDVTTVKALAHCPDDIRIIYDPIESSKTIFVREKKIVYVCKMMDDDGGLLELEKMGISLFVPAGAIPFNQRSLVSLVLNWDLNDNPLMEKKEALVSPVVYCGPHGTMFDKPCILKFKHCAHDTRFAKVLTSQTDLFEAKSWQDVNSFLDSDEEGEGKAEMPCVQAGVSLSVNECEVEVPHFSLFTCIMGSKSRFLKKWIQVAVFTHDIGPERRHQQIRVYFLNKTPCALQWAIQNEAQYNYTLACPDTTFLFMESGENMMVHLSYVSDGWEAVCKDTDDPVRNVFFEQIWHGACPHASMCFRRLKNTREDSTLSAATEKELKDSRGSRASGGGGGGASGGGHRLGDSGKDTVASSDTRTLEEIECSEINIALILKQEMCDNLSVPLDILAHNLRVNIMDTQVKVIDDGPC